MTLTILTSLLLTLTSSLMLATNPLTTGLTILSMALCVSAMYTMLISSWYAFLIFLIYIGGMLVMFSYFVALIPNQPSMYITHLSTLISTFAIILLISTMSGHDTPMISFNSFQLHTLYSLNNNTVLIMMAIILLLTMVIIVKITHWSKGPLRAFMAYV